MTRRSAPFYRLLASGAALSLVLVATPGADAKVGVAAAVNTDARGRPPGLPLRVISIGENVVYNEEIVTDDFGLVQILLLDGTTFTVGPGSQITIDEFVYDPNSGDAKVVASVTKGALRFIGGQTSRKEGGATIKTPVGTIGIRGAMAEMSIDPGRESIFSMVFGQSLDFVGRNGKKARIYRPGYTLEVKGGPGGATTKTRPRTKADVQAFQTALAGKPGKNGGAKKPPTDKTVAESPVSAVGSSLPLIMNILPSQRPLSPVQSTDADGVIDIGGELAADQSADIIRHEIETEEGPVPPPPPPPDGNARVLTAPGVYQDLSGTIPAAGSRGLVGSTAASDRAVALVQRDGRLVSNDGNITLPDLTGSQGDGGLVRIDVQPGEASWNGHSLSGPAYAGAGDFAAYFLGIDGDPTRPFYTITGTGTNLPALFSSDSGDGVREYTLTQDPIRPGRLPFFSQEIYGSTANANVTNLLVVEPNDSDSGQLEALLTGLHISGEGSAQRSAVLVFTAGTSVDANGNASFGGSRRGSMRTDASESAITLRGGVSTLAGPGGAHLFGDNGENFVLGTEIGDHFQDSALRFSDTFTGDPLDGYVGDGGFATHHVADLVGEVPQASLSRTTRNQLGFASGLSESWANAPGEVAVLGSLIPDFELNLDAAQHTARAFAFPVEMFNRDPVLFGYQIRFGEDETGGGGNSTFVDDHRFAATQNNRSGNTRLITDTERSLSHVQDRNPGSYMVSGRATPIAGYQHCPTCDFIDWGWWGTQIQIEADGSSGIPQTRRDMVHLGTWVAGQLTNVANLPTDIIATYEGTALGNVARTTDSGTYIYIAAGTFDLTYDFHARRGTVNLNDFDGIDAEVQVAQYDQGSVAGFWGGGYLDEGDVQMVVSGAFADDGNDAAAGVLGEFGIDGDRLRIAGTLVGERTGTRPAIETIDARVLTAPKSYRVAGDSTAYPVPGDRGLVGSTPQTDRNIPLQRVDGRLVNTQLGIDIPDLENASNGVHTITGVLDGQFGAGVGFAGAGDFAAYLLTLGGDPSKPWAAITGTPTSNAVFDAMAAGGYLRTYSMTEDPLAEASVPFFRTDLYGSLNNVSNSGFQVLEGGGTADIKAFEAWVDISGSGLSQRSAVFVLPTNVFQDEDSDYVLFDGRRGSFRYHSERGPAILGGTIHTLGGVEGNEFFGGNAEHFVIRTETKPAGTFSDDLLGPGFTGNPADGYLGDGYPFSTTHIASLSGVTPTSTLSRTSRSYEGFMAGIGESRTEGIASPYILMSTNHPNFALNIDATHNTVGATGEVFDRLGMNEIVQGYLLTFGEDSRNPSSSAFVDDNRFGAIQANRRQDMRLRTDGGQSIAALNKDGGYPHLYMVSGRAAPVEGYQHCTQCSFMDWGWWGQRLDFQSETPEFSGTRNDFVHMGTWVAGDIADPADLPTNISVNYAGTALGTVTRQTTEGVAKYIARGDMNMSFDFASRSGNMQINNFDGMSVSGLISENSTVNQALFRGNLAGSGMNGAVQGAFVNNGANVAAGVIGNFGLRGEGVSATGTIAGVRAPASAGQ